FIHAPAQGIRAMLAPNGTSAGDGNSFATPITGASLALALSINPSLTTSAARDLLRDSACKTGQEGRLDGTTCAPSTDSEAAKVGYLDLLQLVRMARASSGKSPLLACTGGWDAEELKDDDTFKSAQPLPPLKPVIHAVSEFRPAKADLSIHRIRKG